MDPGLMTPRALGLIPPGVVDPSDQATVEVYFNRHPWELSMGPEFVGEMNANVLTVLQQNPHAIVDSLSAIGHSYLGADSSLAVLNYRARILATLRSMHLSQYSLEEMVFMLLGLSAIELVDSHSGTCTATASETTIPAVIANSAALIRHYLSLGRELSPLARYFTRALARQDMILSLVHLHRPLIPTAVWLDQQAQTSADRLMGYTTTLMPLLEELCILAEDMRHLQQEDSVRASADSRHLPGLAGPDRDKNYYAQRADDLRTRIELWKPSLPHGLSFRRSRRFLSQAACYRAGALLYLFRLLHPATPGGGSGGSGGGSSSSSNNKDDDEDGNNYNNNNNNSTPSSLEDKEATARAHEVLMSANAAANNPDEVKMLLWPVFLAACEMSAEEDRQMVLDILDAILEQRKTATVQKIKSFVLNRVWPARDQAGEWNWWILAQRFPGECLPI